MMIMMMHDDEQCDENDGDDEDDDDDTCDDHDHDHADDCDDWGRQQYYGNGHDVGSIGTKVVIISVCQACIQRPHCVCRNIGL